MSKYFCTRCGGLVEVLAGRPSLDPRYAIGRCRNHKPDKSAIEVQATASESGALGIIATQVAARLRRHEISCGDTPPGCKFGGCKNSARPNPVASQ